MTCYDIFLSLTKIAFCLLNCDLLGVFKNHLTADYLYIRADNSSTDCTNILYGFCKMLWYCNILFILNRSGQLWIKQTKNNNTFYCFKCIHQSFKHSLLTGLSEFWLYTSPHGGLLGWLNVRHLSSCRQNASKLIHLSHFMLQLWWTNIVWWN